MKHLPILVALGVFLGLALALWTRRVEAPDDSLFGAEVELTTALAPLELARGSLELAGRVETAAGVPAEDVFIALVRPEDDPARSEPLYHAYTDAEGRFALAALAPGSYRVVLMHPSAPPRELALELPATGFDPGAIVWVLAEPLPPLPVLPDIRRTALAGRVLAPAVWSAGAALDGFEVVLIPAADTPLLSGASQRRALTDADGRFAFTEVVVASYQVELLPPWARAGSWPVLARGACAAVEGTQEEIVLTPAVGALEGELREAGDEPLVGALVEVTAIEALDPLGKPQLWPPEVSDEAGRYHAELLPPGRYRVHLRAGPAARDVEVVVEAGLRTQVPLQVLDLRSAENAGGG